MSKLMYKNTFEEHVQLRGTLYYFVRRVPADLRDQYKSDRISQSLRTKSLSSACRLARSISQRLEDYWLGLRLQKLDIPSINLVRMDAGQDEGSGFRLSQALELYLKLKGGNRDKVFIRTAHRNTEYVIRILGDRNVTSYSSADAGQFRDWMIDKGMGRSTIKRVFSSIRSIVNLAIREQGLEGQNGFVGTYMPDGLKTGERKAIPTDVVRNIQKTCIDTDDDLRWLIALLSDSGMRLGEAVGLSKIDIITDTELPYIDLKPHPWRRLKTAGSERKVPLVGASLWAAKRALETYPNNPHLFPRYCDHVEHNANSASAALNKWLKSHAPKGCVVHSFRHSIRDRLRAVECPSDITDQIGGWITAGVGQTYGSGYPLEVLHNWMRKIA
jgi:integrase